MSHKNADKRINEPKVCCLFKKNENKISIAKEQL